MTGTIAVTDQGATAVGAGWNLSDLDQLVLQPLPQPGSAELVNPSLGSPAPTVFGNQNSGTGGTFAPGTYSVVVTYTGVDGLQKVCNRLIINVLPWTRAEYDQLLGRI